MLKGFVLSLKTQSHWVTSGFVIGSQQAAVCQHDSDLFLKLKLSTQCIKFLFFRHVQCCRQSRCTSLLQKGRWLHDWFHYYVIQMFDSDKKNFECFDVAVTYCLNWMSARNMLFVVRFLHCRLFFMNLYFFYMYCENVLFYDNSYFLFFWRVKKSHEHFVRNKRKYLLSNLTFKMCFLCVRTVQLYVDSKVVIHPVF